MTTHTSTAAVGVAVANRALSASGVYHGSCSKYGYWWHPNYKCSLWCAMGASWCVDQAVGTTLARRIIGQQAPTVRSGGASTVWLRRFLLDNGGVRVSREDARPGDLLFMKFPTSDPNRVDNVVNHMDVVVGNIWENLNPTVGFNTTAPGSWGDPSSGRGVWRHRRGASYVESIIRPDYSHAVSADPADPAAPADRGYTQRRHPVVNVGDKGVAVGVWERIAGRPVGSVWSNEDAAAAKAVQRRVSVVADGEPGPKTAAAYLASKSPIRRGATGHHVRLVQYLVGLPTTSLGSTFGPVTEEAVRQAQRRAALSADGVVGKATIRALT